MREINYTGSEDGGKRTGGTLYTLFYRVMDIMEQDPKLGERVP